jgi:hypothetical protein
MVRCCFSGEEASQPGRATNGGSRRQEAGQLATACGMCLHSNLLSSLSFAAPSRRPSSDVSLRDSLAEALMLRNVTQSCRRQRRADTRQLQVAVEP